jgi:multidrug efflux pump subunit AcrA (membrane-fusion protein)
MDKRRWWWAIPPAVIVVVIGLAVTHRSAPRTSAAAAPAVSLATVRETSYAVVLTEAGYVGAPAGTTVQLAFPNAGILREMYVHVGERVSAGQPLAALDTRALALDAAQARAEAQAAEAGYEGGSVPKAAVLAARERLSAAEQRVVADRIDLERAQRLYAAGVTAQKDVQAAQAQLAADEANATSARADLRSAGSQPQVLDAQARAAQARAASAELLLRQGTLRTPTDGIVTAILRKPGESVDPSTAVIAIGPAQRETTLRVPATDAAQIAVGDPVALQLADETSSTLGRVIAVVPSLDQSTQTATVVVAGYPPGAIAGAAVRARITVARVRGLVVPESAIVSDPQSGDDVVFVRRQDRDGAAKFVPQRVTIAHEDGTTAQLSSGVRAGERVAAQGAFELLAPAGGGD